MSGFYDKYGALTTHNAFMHRPQKRGLTTPFQLASADVFTKQVAGLTRRLKAIKCQSVVVGISGGLDSTLALLVCVGAFEKLSIPLKNLHAITMPGFGTSRRTYDNAALLCKGLGVKLEEISIVKSVTQHLKDIGHNGKKTDVTYENAQARMRTMILMDKANMYNALVIGTGDMSEIALGWCTYNGDHMSMFAVNNGVPKTVVTRVCSWYASRPGLNRNVVKAIKDIVATPVSPELIKGQVTEDKLGPYELHDFFLWNFIVNGMGPEELLKAAMRRTDMFPEGKYTEAFVKKTIDIFMTRLVTQAFKRNCQPDGIKIFPFEFSPRDWWIPSDLDLRDVMSHFEK